MKSILCKKCGLKFALQEQGYYPYCYICALKLKGKYKSAKEELSKKSYFGNNWWTYHTKWDFKKLGWSFAPVVYFKALLGNVLNCASINETPKMPELMDKTLEQQLKVLGVSQWQVNQAIKYYSF
ncbi:hypothetical protein LCGC14_1117380 [marine sediment metagenome]|uniref:Uncharacterized protein n=1 Tax=marine sediment metagenome TaxID=412755 RepID=A0A0F9PN29_9ZZZZ